MLCSKGDGSQRSQRASTFGSTANERRACRVRCPWRVRHQQRRQFNLFPTLPVAYYPSDHPIVYTRPSLRLSKHFWLAFVRWGLCGTWFVCFNLPPSKSMLGELGGWLRNLCFWFGFLPVFCLSQCELHLTSTSGYGLHGHSVWCSTERTAKEW